MDAVSIRHALPRDKDKLQDVQRRASIVGETGETLRRLLTEPEHFDIDISMFDGEKILMAEIDGKPVGFASYLPNSVDEAELDGMFVDPDHWRRGIARSLLGSLARQLNSLGFARIRVVANPNALEFYKSVGFDTVGAEVTPLGPSAPVMMRQLDTVA